MGRSFRRELEQSIVMQQTLIVGFPNLEQAYAYALACVYRVARAAWDTGPSPGGKGGTVTFNTQEDRARRYRDLAAQTRASADATKHEAARRAMLEAASVWDQLADLADRQVNIVVKTTLPRGRPRA